MQFNCLWNLIYTESTGNEKLYLIFIQNLSSFVLYLHLDYDDFDYLHDYLNFIRYAVVISKLITSLIHKFITSINLYVYVH